jgi:hypothetical protein
MSLLQRCSHTQSEGPKLSLIRSANWGPGREMPPIHWPGLPFRHLLNLKPHRLSKWTTHIPHLGVAYSV